MPPFCSNPLTDSQSCGYELSFQVFMIFCVNDFATRMQASVGMPFIARKLKALSLSRDKSLNVDVMGPIEKQYRLLQEYRPTEELVRETRTNLW